ncbi:hypothetical protein ACJVDH_16200 [Pedobacter sp. AW1-32]|uniref:hypothetical protein n=1 Tax=Pedobacter sp. AW1-32 TaxID=3383026 RepID=UPI003FED6917
MKKTLIAFLALFVISMGCKKIMDTDPLCACSPVTNPYFSLVIKNLNGVDLLDTTKPGSFDHSQIQLYSKDANGNPKSISFVVRPPFSYGSDQFIYNQLLAPDISMLAKSIDDVFYLKLGNNAEFALNLKFNNFRLEKLLLNGVELPLQQPGTNYTYVDAIYALII